jgi:hypothetical protein
MEETYSAFKQAQREFDKVAEMLKLDTSYQEVLRELPGAAQHRLRPG